MAMGFPKCGHNRNSEKIWHSYGAFKKWCGKLFTAFWPLIWRTSHIFCLNILVIWGVHYRYMPMVKSTLDIEATWPIFPCICWRSSTLGIFYSLLLKTFHLGQQHIHLGGDLGSFHCLLWGVSCGSINLEAFEISWEASPIFNKH